MRIRTNHYLDWPGHKWSPFVDRPELGLVLASEGQRSIDWPLRVTHTETIRFSGDWMDPRYPIAWQSLALATMALATQHAFITITHHWRNLFSMLSQINDIEERAIPVPADITYVRAIERANRHKGRFNLARSLHIPADPARAKKAAVHAKSGPLPAFAEVPWLPRNIFFGVSVYDVFEAEEAVFVMQTARKLFPEGKFMIYQGIGEQAIDWEKLGLSRGTIDWLVWNDHPFNNSRLAEEFGRKTGTPVYIHIDEVSAFPPLQETPSLTGVLV